MCVFFGSALFFDAYGIEAFDSPTIHCHPGAVVALNNWGVFDREE